MSSLTGILYTDKANAHPTVHERKPVLELLIQHIAHATGQLLCAESVCEWVCTSTPTGLIFVKKKKVVYTHIHTRMAASTRLR